MNNIFINATAAREGGALTILEMFCKSKKDSKDFFYIYSPIEPTVMPINSCWVKKETSGIGTLFFSLLFSWFFCLKHECVKLISFSNLNSLLPIANKVTYFHNLLILNSPSIKYKIIRFALRYLNQRDVHYIFQTPYVRDLFSKSLAIDVKSNVCWPGILNDIKCDLFDGLPISFSNYSKRVVVPITNLQDSNKNFDYVLKLAIINPNVLFVVTAPTPVDERYFLDNLYYIGYLSRPRFISLLEASDGVLITSKCETVCLPIFEALIVNRPAFVLDSDYIHGLKDMFGHIDGMYSFHESHDFVKVLLKSELTSKCFFNPIYSSGNWDF